jgi:hypothetical protein
VIVENRFTAGGIWQRNHVAAVANDFLLDFFLDQIFATIFN